MGKKKTQEEKAHTFAAVEHTNRTRKSTVKLKR